MTQRPQSQSPTFSQNAASIDDDNHDEIQLLSSSPATVFTNSSSSSSWQEEAHWMSFRYAVQYFSSSLSIIDYNHPTTAAATCSNGEISLNDSGSTKSSSLVAALKDKHQQQQQYSSPPVIQIGVRANAAVSPSSSNINSDGPVPALTEKDTNEKMHRFYQNSSASTKSSSSGSSSSSSPYSTTNSTISSNNKTKNHRSLASDLAETKMRLALAQAERDELEFALMNGTKQLL